MKKLLLIVVFCIISNLSGIAQDYQVKCEVFGSNFKGVVQKDSIVLVYGTNGIILRSIDYGYTWDKIQAFDLFSSFYKIIVKDNVFTAICYSNQNNNLIAISNDGINWTEYSKFEYGYPYDIVAKGDELFVFYKTLPSLFARVGKIDINKNFQEIFNEKDYNLKNGVYDRFVLHKNKFYFESWSKLYVFDYITNKLDSIEVTDMFPIAQKWVKTQFPRSINGNLYVCAMPALLKSTNDGENWEVLTIDSSTTYDIQNDTVYSLNVKMNWDNCKISDFKLNKIFNSIEENVGSEKWARYVQDVKINEMKFINNNTIAACGTNSFLAVSYNKGKSWNLINYLKSGNETKWRDNMTGFSTGFSGVLNKTTDGGKFWRPQLFIDSMYSMVYFSLEKPDKALSCGFEGVTRLELLKNNKLKVIDFTPLGFMKNILTSNDEGEITYPKEDDDYATAPYLSPIYHNTNNYIIGRDDVNLNGKRYHFSTIRKYDSNYEPIYFKPISHWYIDGFGIRQNNDFYAYAYDGSDSLFEKTSDKIYLIKSNDEGDTWTKIKIMDSCYKYESFIFSENYFDASEYDTLSKATIIRRFDIETGEKIDSISLDFRKTNYLYFKTGKRAIIFQNKKIFINENIESDLKKWTKIESEHIPQFYANDQNGDNYYGTISAFPAKVTITSTSGVVENSDYLYAMPPYPVPAKDYVKGKFYYDYNGGLSKTDINIYNCFGAKVAGKKDIEITSIESNYTAELKWNCSQALTGVYMIVITTPNGKSQTLPVMVAR